MPVTSDELEARAQQAVVGLIERLALPKLCLLTGFKVETLTAALMVAYMQGAVECATEAAHE
jgi:hypothetical protein